MFLLKLISGTLQTSYLLFSLVDLSYLLHKTECMKSGIDHMKIKFSAMNRLFVIIART